MASFSVPLPLGRTTSKTFTLSRWIWGSRKAGAARPPPASRTPSQGVSIRGAIWAIIPSSIRMSAGSARPRRRAFRMICFIEGGLLFL